MHRNNVLAMLDIKPKKKTKPRKFIFPEGKCSVTYYHEIDDELMMDNKTFEEIWNLHPKEYAKIMVAEQLKDTNRFVEGYSAYDTFDNIPHPYLRRLLSWVRKHSGQDYRNLLINFYPSGFASIGAHSDSREGLLPGTNIYSFSFGQERDFVISSKIQKFRKVFPLANNSLIIMEDEIQQYYKHAVPKRTNAKGRRINITFRVFAEDAVVSIEDEAL